MGIEQDIDALPHNYKAEDVYEIAERYDLGLQFANDLIKERRKQEALNDRKAKILKLRKTIPQIQTWDEMKLAMSELVRLL